EWPGSSTGSTAGQERDGGAMNMRVNTLWQRLRGSLAVNPGRFAASSAVSGPLGLLAVEAERLAQERASTTPPGGEILDVRSRTVDGTRVRYAESDGPGEPCIL